MKALEGKRVRLRGYSVVLPEWSGGLILTRYAFVESDPNDPEDVLDIPYDAVGVRWRSGLEISPCPRPPDGRGHAAARKRRGGTPEGRAPARGRRAGRAGEDALRPSEKSTYDENRTNFTLGRPADGTLPARFDGMSEVHYIGGGQTPEDRLDDPSLYFNREISWLAFNERVLEEALRSHSAARAAQVPGHLPLQPRRVLHDPRRGSARAARGGGDESSADGLPPEQLGASARSSSATPRAAQALLARICCRRSRAGMRSWLGSRSTRTQLGAVAPTSRACLPVLTPLAVDPAHPFPFLSNLSLSLAVELPTRRARSRFARVKVPPSLPRFVPVPGGTGAGLRSSCCSSS